MTTAVASHGSSWASHSISVGAGLDAADYRDLAMGIAMLSYQRRRDPNVWAHIQGARLHSLTRLHMYKIPPNRNIEVVLVDSP